LREIESIEYSILHRSRAQWGSFVLILVGANAAIVPVVAPVVLGDAEDAYSRARFPAMVAGGVVLFLCGLRMAKSYHPKVYNLSTDWSYQVVKK
jgi:hypothetical protein